MNLPISFCAGFAEGIEETISIPVVQENGLATVTTVHDVVDSAWIFHSQFASHKAWESVYLIRLNDATTLVLERSARPALVCTPGHDAGV